MDGRAGHGALRRREAAEADGEAGRGGGAHAEVRIAEGLVRQRGEGDRLGAPGEGEGDVQVRRQLVGAVPPLGSEDGTRALPDEMDGGAGWRGLLPRLP